jgi:nucleotide-binding universal stress UspA family protein
MSMTAVGHILVAHDFGAPARAALRCALRLATDVKARVTVAHVYDLPVYGFEGMSAAHEVEVAITSSASAALDQVVAEARAVGVEADRVLRRGCAWGEIARIAVEIGADLVVVGTHGRRGLQHDLLGSVAEKVVRTSPRPVLVVHCTGDAPASVGRVSSVSSRAPA